MNKNIFKFILFFSTLGLANEAQKSEWKVLNTQGVVTALTGDASKNLSVGQVLEGVKSFGVESGTLKVFRNSQEWYLFANSELDLTVENPILKKGSLRLITNEPTRFRIQTPVAQVNLDGRDFILIYHQERARLEVSVLDGKVWIKGIYREEEQQLEKNSKGGFQGVMEKEGPAFDQMLQGKKVVRGDLLGVQAIKPEELDNLKKTYYLENQKVIVKEKPKPKKGQICEEPFAKLNECVWHLKAGKCVRERCYASGVWGDSTTLSDKQKLFCGKGEKVAPCDY
jgi:hypothetical protein